MVVRTLAVCDSGDPDVIATPVTTVYGDTVSIRFILQHYWLQFGIAARYRAIL